MNENNDNITKSKKRNILLVEDDKLIADMERIMLEKYGYSVNIVNNGKKAIETVNKNHNIDLILMDIDLGEGIDGTETAQIILKERDIPVVFLSSYSEPEIVEKTEKITSYGYILKSSSITVIDASIKMAFKLFETKQKHKNTFDYSINGLCIHKMIYDKNGVPYDCEYIDVNPSYENHTGLKAKLIVGKTICDLYPENEADDVIKLYVKVVKTGKPETKEIFFKPLDSWFLINVFSMQDDYFTVVVQNITKRKRAEEELRNSENQKNAILNGIKSNIALVDKDLKIIWVNTASAKSVNKHPDELIGNFCYSFWGDSVKPCDNCPTLKAFKTGKSEHKIIYSPTGKVWDESGEPIFDSDGNITAVVEVATDITKLKMNEEKLIESEKKIRNQHQELEIINEQIREINEELFSKNEELESKNNELKLTNEEIESTNEELASTNDELIVKNEKLKITNDKLIQANQIIENMQIGLHLYHLENIEDDNTLRMIYANPITEKLTGIKVKDIIGKTLDENFPGLRKLNVPQRYAEIVRTQKIKTFEDIHYNDERIVSSVYSVKAFPLKNNHIGVLFDDMTSRHKTQEKIQSLLSEKEMLLNETHHRIKNNMNVIRSILMLEANKQDNNSNCKHILDDCANRIITMMTLYDYLYKNEIKIKIKISYYLKNLIEQFLEIYKHKSFHVEVDIQDIDMTPKIISKIGIIINELFVNSVKYAFEGIENPIISLKITHNNDSVYIVFYDNGIGLPDSVSFEKSDSFGFQLINMLVKELNGTIKVDRTSGTKFIINFNS